MAIDKNPDDKKLQNDVAELLKFWGWTKKQKRMINTKYVREWAITPNPYIWSKTDEQ